MSDNRNPVNDPKSGKTLLWARNSDTRQHCQKVLTALYDIRETNRDHVEVNERRKALEGASLNETVTRKGTQLTRKVDEPMRDRALTTLLKHASNGDIQAEMDKNTSFIRVKKGLSEEKTTEIARAFHGLKIDNLKENIVIGNDPLPTQTEKSHEVSDIERNGLRVAAISSDSRG